MTNIAEQTLASIVTAHHETVPVLEKYQLDFCCKGKRTLKEACAEKGISVTIIADEIKNAEKRDASISSSFTKMNAEQLIQHILLHHHLYVRQAIPHIEEHLEKVTAKHGKEFPYMNEVEKIFAYLKKELLLHMQKEETVLFPRIKEIEALYTYQQIKQITDSYILAPVAMMEHEHDETGALLQQMRTFTNDYAPPADACTTFCIVLKELKAFEENLHQHIHLENNILFPMARKMLS